MPSYPGALPQGPWGWRVVRPTPGSPHATGAAGKVSAPTWLEIGPGAVLSGLLKKIVTGATATTRGTAYEVTTFMES